MKTMRGPKRVSALFFGNYILLGPVSIERFANYQPEQVPWERSALDYMLPTAAEACNVSGFFSYPNFS